MSAHETDSRHHAIPVLFSSDLRSSSVFYSDGLGFAVYKETDGLRIRRSELELKVTHTRDTAPLANLSVVFRVQKIRKLHSEYADRDLPNLGQLKLGVCGKLQFSLSDPDGNSLYFVEEAA
ncbi:VOC family protein [Roseibium sp. SCP14]|uniref:VOC family protein n=1 Tax=Roseibium sp. SCP14 TaxID=3141375 RepID=UPI0033374B7E